mgnify:CR=1 FL=1
MSHVLGEDLIYEVLSVVEEIPEGKVASYGQIARLIGREKNARLVGRILSHAEYYGNYPCHRVVNHAGRTAPGWRQQRELMGLAVLPSRLKDEMQQLADCLLTGKDVRSNPASCWKQKVLHFVIMAVWT